MVGGLPARIVRRMIERCARYGFDQDRLCSLVGLDFETLQDPEIRLPFTIVEELGKQALALTGDEAFGLHLAEDLRDRRRYDVGLLLLMSAPDLGTALERFVRSQDYWGDGQRAALSPTPTGLAISYELPSADAEYARHAAECAIGELVVGAEVLVGQPVRPTSVQFRHPRPRKTITHERVFGLCPLFGAERNQVEFDHSSLGLSLKNSSDDFFDIFAQQVEEKIAHLDRSSSTANDVRVAARATLSRGGPSLSDIARILRTSPRTLQRRLQEEGTTFGQVIESLRQELAHSYLRDKTPVTEVASRLGYADASAFCHAFRRWTGASPTARTGRPIESSQIHGLSQE